MPVRVLLVDTDRASDTERALTSAGHVVTRTFGFAEAKQSLQTAPPDLLMTDVRLGAYNGLHLVIRAQTLLDEGGDARGVVEHRELRVARHVGPGLVRVAGEEQALRDAEARVVSGEKVHRSVWS